MLSAYDAWLLPPEPRIPELENEDRERILLDILWSSFRQSIAVAYVPDHVWRKWVSENVLKNEAVFEALIAQHKEAIDEWWAEEHQP